MSLLAVSQRSTDVWIGLGESWIHWIMGCGTAGTCAGGRKSESSGPWCFQSCSMYVRLGLTRDLRRRLNSFGTRSLRGILGYRCSDFVPNERLLRETQMRFVTRIVREHQLWLYGHVAHFPDANLLTRYSQRGSLLSGGGQWADHVPRGCRWLISTSRGWEWARQLPMGWPDGGTWSTGRKWMQRSAAPAHAPIPDLTSVSSILLHHGVNFTVHLTALGAAW